MNRDNVLFNNKDSFSVVSELRQKIAHELASIDEDRILNTDPSDLVKYFKDNYSLAVPVLYDLQKTIEQREATREDLDDRFRVRGERIQRTGIEITLEVPFSGNPNLFYVQPNQHDMGPPRADVRLNHLEAKFFFTEQNPESMKGSIDQWIAHVNNYLTWLRGSFSEYNSSIENTARAAIDQRRSRLLANRSLVASLGIPLKRNPEAPSLSVAAVARRIIPPSLPPATPGKFKPEPELEESEYLHILSVIENMAKVMERNPTAFHSMAEEDLRTHFLVQLNGQYMGQATGETFNGVGKTDILLRIDGRNAFIAECKFWSGPATLDATINQISGYLSWRDSKAAIVIFNKNKDLSKVLLAVQETVPKHSLFIQENGKRSETSFRYVFRNKDDPAKHLHLSVMVFDIPAIAKQTT